LIEELGLDMVSQIYLAEAQGHGIDYGSRGTELGLYPILMTYGGDVE